MNNRRNSAILLVLIATLALAPAAMANQYRIITNYWGNFCGPGGAARCFCVIGPTPPPELVGQVVRECGGSTWSWGLTECDNTTVEYEDCFEAAAEENASAAAAQETEAAEEADACETIQQ